MDAAWALATRYATQLPIDAAIAEIAKRQHGVIALEQLVILGLSPTAVRSRVARGRLHRIHRGVYAVGYPKLTRKGRWMAAVLACGEGAVLSHLSGAHLATLSSWSGPIEITSRGRKGRRRPGITVHSGGTLRPQDLTEVDGIPCTTWARLLVDLAATRPRQVVQKALNRTETLRIFNLPELEDAMQAVGPRAGVGELRAMLAEYEIGSNETESISEDDFLALCARFRIPNPRCNFWMEIAGRWVRHDFFWPEQRVSVEIDGFATHGTHQGFKSDRRRDRNLILNTDIALLRFAASEVRFEPATVARDVISLLRKRTSAPR